MKTEILRPLKECGCEANKQKNWGYQVHRWIGGKDSWKFVANTTDAVAASFRAARWPIVLIRCQGCGAELVREYPNLATEPKV